MRRSSSLRGFVLRRVAWVFPTVLLVMVLVFLVFQQLADPAAIELGIGASRAELTARRHELGLDRGLGVRLLEQLGNFAHLDLGESRLHRRPVEELIARALLPTLAYAIPGFLLATHASVFGGLNAARNEGRASDWLLSSTATAVVSTSSLVVVLAAQTLLAHEWGLFPVSWPLTQTSQLPEPAYLALPALLWALVQFGPDLRHFRAVFVQELRRPCFDAMRARGLDERAIRRLQLRCAAGPICARIGHRLPYLLVGSVVIEYLFNIPGIGRLLVDALRSSDLALMQGLAVGLTFVTILTQLCADVAAGLLDPRLRRW